MIGKADVYKRQDEEGKLVFQADLPHGKYYIQEVEHKPGYLPNDEVYSFDASYTCLLYTSNLLS